MRNPALRVRISPFVGLILALVGASTAAAPLEMSYTAPATAWKECLPIGNGRLGGMIYGTTAEEHLQFNEDTLWIGGPHDDSHAGAASHLASIRNAMFAGNSGAAGSEISTYFLSVPLRQRPFQPFGDLYFTGHPAVTNYTRKLDVDQAISTVEYDVGAVHYTREFFASHPHNVIVSRIAASTPGAVNTTIRMTSPQTINGGFYNVSVVGGNRLVLAGRLPLSGTYNGQFHSTATPLFFEAQARVIIDGGTLNPSGNTLVVSGADAVTILLVARTSFVNFQDVSGDPHARCEADMAALDGLGYEALKNAHMADYQSLFRRVSLDLGATDPAIAALPIATRLRDMNNTANPALSNRDPDLVELYYQFGRYLLIASSRPGAQPANLQGLWNPMTDPSWESKYTTNINVQMNYWPAETANLAECVDPLVAMIDDLRISGHLVAQAHYNARGWVVHHNTDLWRGAAPINNATDGCYPAGAAWLCQHLWWHYEYSGDQTFLANDAYPAMREAALFYIDFLVPDPRPAYHNWLVSTPSYSPEQGGLCVSPTMDNQIIRQFLRDTIAAAQTLGVDEDLRTTLTQIVARIPPNQIGSWGQIMEWLDPNSLDNSTNKHRHVSHLWGLFPGEDITAASPTLFNAARVSLVARGYDSTMTGWGLAHRLNLWARQRDGNTAYAVLQVLFRSKTLLSLLNRGGATTIDFQIDGNLGGASGIAEMLLQSHGGEVCLLPALPDASSPAGWQTGSVSGLRARGGLTVNMNWDGGLLTGASLHAAVHRTIRLRVPVARPVLKVTRVSDNAEVPLEHNLDGTVSLAVEAGLTYHVWFTSNPPYAGTEADWLGYE